MRNRTLVLAVALWGLFGPTYGAAQTTLRVPVPYPTIQQAVLAAAPTGDTIVAAPGTYIESVFINKDLVLRSSGGAFVTTIDGGGLSAILVDCVNAVVIDGFTLTNGAYGVHLTYCGNGVVRNNRIHGNALGGIDAGGGSFHIVGNTIANNTAREGGGISGGQSGGWTQVYRNVITGNRASLDGGGIHFNGGNWGCNIFENTVAGNTAGRDGGGIYYEPWNCDCDNNVIVGNTAGRDGGGVYRSWTRGGQDTMSHCTVAFNNAGNSGGGVALIDGGTHTIDKSIFWGNRAPAGAQIGLGQSPAALSVLSIRDSIVDGGLAGVSIPSPLSTLNWGPGMSSADPMFVDPASNDLHLRASSPAIDATQGLFASDFEGDRRRRARMADIGADERATHLYLVGQPRLGSAFALRAIGRAGTPVVVAIGPGSTRRSPSVVLPGIGVFVVPDPFTIVPLGTVGSAGFASVTLRLPPSFPTPTPFVVQALVGGRLTNAVDVWVY